MKEYSEQFMVCPYCGYVHGTPAKEAYHIVPGSLLQNRYTVGRVLGFGGFGITYIGYDNLLQKTVAIKEYLPGEFSTRMPNQQAVTVYTGEREEQFEEGKKKMLDEARRLAKFQNVPNIVHNFDCFEANNTCYIIMEYVDGETVKEILAREGKLSVDQALQITLKVIAGMKAVHKEGIIHRDIAPDNIKIQSDGEVKILDFGAARYATTKHSKSLSVIIKPGYAPEEQYRSRGDQGPWTDVYALAATFYKMITGVTPEDAMERSVKDMLKKPSKMGVTISKPMETAIMNALVVTVEDRTQSMEEFEQELMAADVKEKVARNRKKDVGKMPVAAKVTIGLGIAAAVVMTVIALFITIRPPVPDAVLPQNMTTVPNVVNKEQETAGTMLTEKSLAVGDLHNVYDAVIPRGTVTGQSIERGKIVEKNNRVDLDVSLGREQAVVPQMQGLMKEDALAALEKVGLKAEIREVSDTSRMPGEVKSQSVEQGLNIDKGSTVTIMVVKDEGQGQEEVDTTEMIEVPDVMGMTEDEARELLSGSFQVTFRHTYEDTNDNKDRIIAMDQPAGGELAKNSMITLTISDGIEKVQVPDVINQYTESEAAEMLEAAGFVPVTGERQYSETVKEGNVISQSLSGAQEKGSEVVLVISRGPRPKETKPQQTQPPQTQAPQPQQTQPPQTQPPQTQPPQTEAPPPPQTEAPPPPPQTEAAPPPAQPAGGADDIPEWLRDANT